MIFLVFVPLVIGWALLHRASCRPSWGYIGRPMTAAELRVKVAMRRMVQRVGEEIIPAFDRMNIAMRKAADAFASCRRP